MASTFTPSLKLELQGTGENNNTWGTKLNDAVTRIDESISGVYSKALSNGNNTVSVANGVLDESRQAVLVLTGALSGSAAVIMPDIDRVQAYVNNTTGNQVVTIRNSAGTGFTLPANTATMVYCDGTSVRPLSFSVLATNEPSFTSISVSTARFTQVNVDGTVSASTGRFTGLVNAASVSATWGALNTLNVASQINANFVSVSANVIANQFAGNQVSVSGANLTTVSVTGELRVPTGIVSASTGNFTTLGSRRITTSVGIGSLVSVPYAASVQLDFSAGNNFVIGALTGNITLMNPSNQTPGQSGSVFIYQDATGGRTITFGSEWLFAGGTDPTLTSTSSSRDVLNYFTVSSGAIYASLLQDFR